MLRTTPKVNKIYLLIRAKDKEAAFLRLKNEIMESELFKYLEEMHGESYKIFMQNKLVPIIGNIYEPNLGMDIITYNKIAQEIDLIVDSAAITTFDERYDLALNANVNGPYQLMMFAKKCKKLKLLMHYSTGSERTISLMGWGITGVSRALMVRDARLGQGPGSGRDQNGIIRVAPVSALSMWVRVQTEFRQILVPFDMVVNATMAAIAKHGYLQNPELNVYHLASSSQNPVSQWQHAKANGRYV
ncbi:putative fatty acyl-CoA reductase 2-like [Capsicum annuum]|nr:putative fatty acyl-CoA reductase 2-like [Capsicum annuum]